MTFENRNCHEIGASGGALYLLTVVMLYSLYLFNFPSASWRAEPYAETAVVYYPLAVSEGFVRNILEREFVHLPVLARLISVSAAKVFQLTYAYPQYVQLMCCLFIAAFSSAFVLPWFRWLIANDFARFIISLTLGTHWGWGMYQLHNLGYWSAPVAVLFAFGSRIPLHRFSGATLLGFTLLNLPGKASAIVVLPFFLFHGTRYFFCRPRNLGGGVQFLLLSLPLVYLIYRNSDRAEWSGVKLSVSVLLQNTAVLYWKSLHDIFLGFFVPRSFSDFGSAMIFGLVLLLFTLLWRKRDVSGIMTLVIGNLVGLASLALTIKGFYPDLISWHSNISFADDSHFYLSGVSIFASVSICLCRVFPLNFSLVLLIAFSCFSNVFGFLRANDPYRDQSESFSRWRIYSAFLGDADYCIPVNPEGWFLRKNCDELPGPIQVGVARKHSVEGTSSVRLISVISDGISTASEIVIRHAGDNEKIRLAATSKIIKQDGTSVSFFYLPRPVMSPFKLVAVDDAGSPMRIDSSDIHIFGTTKSRFTKPEGQPTSGAILIDAL